MNKPPETAAAPRTQPIQSATFTPAVNAEIRRAAACGLLVRSVGAACALCVRRWRALVHGWGASVVRVHGWVRVHMRVRACASACERV